MQHERLTTSKHFTRQESHNFRERNKYDDSHNQQDKKRECCFCDIKDVSTGESLDDKQVETNRWSDLGHFNYNNQVDSKPYQVDTSGFIIGKITEVVRTTIEMPSRKQPSTTKNNVSTARSM